MKGDIGLIAGNGQFPLLFARAARQAGKRVVAVAHLGETVQELDGEVDQITWIHVGQLGRLIKTFKRAGIGQAVMCGGVKKTRMFRDLWPDLKAFGLLSKLRQLSDDGILRTLAQVLEDEGIEILPSHLLLPELLALPGIYTSGQPSRAQMSDARLGWQVAGELGRLDIGQAAVVARGVVVAVEGIEGTDACIARGGALAPGDAVVVKRCKPSQDDRFDLPACGVGTIEAMARAGAGCLLIEAGRTLVFDRPRMVALADQKGIPVMAWQAGKEPA